LLRFFDRIQFYPVSHTELTEARAAFLHGALPLRIESGRFNLAEHRRFLATNATEIAQAKSRQQAAFNAERQRWRDQGLDVFVSEDNAPRSADDRHDALPANVTAVHAPVAATIWKVEVSTGQPVSSGQTLVIVESMKMEIRIETPVDGVVRELCCQPGRS